MNIILSGYQSDTKDGDIEVQAGVNLANAEALLCKLGDNEGTPVALLPTAVTDLALYVCLSPVPAGVPTSIEAPTISNARVYAYGTGTTGDTLILADPTANAGAQAGMLRSLVGNQAPVTPGRYFSPGIAEEDFVNGQRVKFRPLPRIVRITSPLNSFVDDSTGAAPAAVAGVVTIPAVATVPEAANAIAAILAQLNAMRAALEAQGIAT